MPSFRFLCYPMPSLVFLGHFYKYPITCKYMAFKLFDFGEEKRREKKEFNPIGFREPKSKVAMVSEHQTGKTTKSIDKKRKALPPGKRISKNGNTYWEYRKNRSDINGV
ncbi:MAG: hypothetical protein ACOC1X_02410, partial [Promethearchaeota archaeon]